MRIAITGEKGFIAKNLANEITKQGHEFVSLDESEFANSKMTKTKSGEVCVYNNSVESWFNLFESINLDCIVHNAAVVGTDVVALNSKHAINTNVLGTQNIVEAANKKDILVVYTGTTVIYDTEKYQNKFILEDSKIFPKTLYAIQKYAGEMIVRSLAKEWLVMRPLFAYGGVGDMNSLIAKSMYAAKNNIENIDMFLDPEKIKDYMHVNDFCNAIMTAILSNVRNKDFNVSANNPYKTSMIIKKVSDEIKLNLENTLNWHPETDYLGNHRLSPDKFRDYFDWKPHISLDQGIKMSWASICSDNTNYNPLVYLEQAKKENIDLKDFFPK